MISELGLNRASHLSLAPNCKIIVFNKTWEENTACLPLGGKKESLWSLDLSCIESVYKVNNHNSMTFQVLRHGQYQTF